MQVLTFHMCLIAWKGKVISGKYLASPDIAGNYNVFLADCQFMGLYMLSAPDAVHPLPCRHKSGLKVCVCIFVCLYTYRKKEMHRELYSCNFFFFYICYSFIFCVQILIFFMYINIPNTTPTPPCVKSFLCANLRKWSCTGCVVLGQKGGNSAWLRGS